MIDKLEGTWVHKENSNSKIYIKNGLLEIMEIYGEPTLDNNRIKNKIENVPESRSHFADIDNLIGFILLSLNKIEVHQLSNLYTFEENNIIGEFYREV